MNALHESFIEPVSHAISIQYVVKTNPHAKTTIRFSYTYAPQIGI